MERTELRGDTLALALALALAHPLPDQLDKN